MMEVSIKVHPLTRKVLLTYYPAEPVILSNHDVTFDLLMGSRNRNSRSAGEEFISDVKLCVREDIARHIEDNASQIAARLFRAHKNQMCWFATTMVHALGNGHARPAIQQWLHLHQVDEDDFPLDTAYKSFQRFGWKIEGKNPHFSGQLRRKTSLNLSRKMKWCRTKRNRARQQFSATDLQVEAALSRFMSAYAETFRRIPVKLEKHARAYFYIKMQGLSLRDVAAKLDYKKLAVEWANKAMKKRIARNPTVGTLITQSFDLPQHV